MFASTFKASESYQGRDGKKVTNEVRANYGKDGLIITYNGKPIKYEDLPFAAKRMLRQMENGTGDRSTRFTRRQTPEEVLLKHIFNGDAFDSVQPNESIDPIPPTPSFRHNVRNDFQRRLELRKAARAQRQAIADHDKLVQQVHDLVDGRLEIDDMVDTDWDNLIRELEEFEKTMPKVDPKIDINIGSKLNGDNKDNDSGNGNSSPQSFRDKRELRKLRMHSMSRAAVIARIIQAAAFIISGMASYYLGDTIKKDSVLGKVIGWTLKLLGIVSAVAGPIALYI